MFRAINGSQTRESFSCSKTSIVRLIVSNLEPSVGLSEWKRILLAQVRAIVQVIHQINVYRQPEGGCYAIAKLASLEDAHMIISQLNRRKLGYRRIRVSLMDNVETIPLENQKKNVTKLLHSAPGQVLAASTLIQMFERKFHRSITLSELYRMRDIVDVKSEAGRKNDRVITLVNKCPNFQSNKIISEDESSLCQIHRSSNQRELSVQLYFPKVNISLHELRPNTTELLIKHGGSIPLQGFLTCYEAVYGLFDKEDLEIVDKISLDSETVEVSIDENDKNSTSETSKLRSPVLPYPRSYVSLEHLLTCIPNVSIQSLNDGMTMVILQENLSTSERLEPSKNISGGRLQGTDMSLIAQNGNKESLAETPSLSGLQQENIRNLRREVVEMVKQQKNSSILLSNFIPTYHNLFGKQCRVADYGFSRLQDVIDALKGAVHTVGIGASKTLLLTHGIQVRRFTHDLLRLLRTEATKNCPLSKLPNLYEEVFRRELIPSNYGVCDLMDLLDDISENTIQVDKTTADPLIVVPKRTQTAEQQMRTLLFGIEIIEMLSEMRHFQITFTKFIPAFHHKFNRQCRVSEYGFVKLIELLEALPHVAEVTEENSEKFIRLTKFFRTTLVKEMILSILQLQSLNRLPLNALQSTFIAHFHFEISLKDLEISKLEDLVTLIQHTNITYIQKDSTNDISESYHSNNLSSTGDGPTVSGNSHENEKQSQQNHSESRAFFCLSDRSQVKQIAYKCLQLLFNSPFGALFEQDFKQKYNYSFNEDIDVGFIQKEMGNFIKVIRSTSDSNLMVNVGNESGCCMNTKSPIECPLQFWGNQGVMREGREHSDTCLATSRLVSLSAIIIFARQLRTILLSSRGRLMLTMLDSMYHRHFGVPLRPEVYGYPSLLTLVGAVNFVAVLRGRGSRATLFLSQDYLGKLAWKIAYNVSFRHQLFGNMLNFEHNQSIFDQAKQCLSEVPNLSSNPLAVAIPAYSGNDLISWPAQNGDQSFMYQLNPHSNFTQSSDTLEQIQGGGITNSPYTAEHVFRGMATGAAVNIMNYDSPFMIGLGPATPELNSCNWNCYDWSGFQYPSNEYINFAPICKFPNNMVPYPLSFVNPALSVSGNSSSYQLQSWSTFNQQPQTSNIMPYVDQQSNSPLACNYITPYCLHPFPSITDRVGSQDTSDVNAKSEFENVQSFSENIATFANQFAHQYSNAMLQAAANPPEVDRNVMREPTINNTLPNYSNYQHLNTNWLQPTVYDRCETNTTDYSVRDSQLQSAVCPENGDESWIDSSAWLTAHQNCLKNSYMENNWSIQNCPSYCVMRSDTNTKNGVDDTANKAELAPSTTPPLAQHITKPVMLDLNELGTQCANRCEDGDWTLPLSMTTESRDCNSKELDDIGSLD